MEIGRILNHVKPNKILDIGANIGGFYNDITSSYSPIERYFAIEGNEYCESYLKDKNIEVYIGLVGQEIGTAKFYRRKSNLLCSGSSMKREIIGDAFSENEVVIDEMKIVTIDSIFGEDDYFDLVKIDTQGSELEILKGGKNLFSRCYAIVLETSVIEYNEGSPLYPEVKEYMESIGFAEIDKVGEGRLPDWTLIQYDVLFINKNLK